MKNPDILGTLEPIIKIFEKIGVSYYIGGSLASSAYGIARATMDIDLVADLSLDHVEMLIKTLEQEYYIDEDMVKEAINRKSSFNVIHLETSMKIDVFVLQDSPYFKNAFSRKRAEILDEGGRLFFLPSPEDIILVKLDWYKLGGCTSERQWNDILGVLKVQKKNLDLKYLQHWATELQLDKLLNNAFIESRITIPPNK